MMPVSHTHSAPGEDLVTYHAAHSVIQVRRHLEREHGISEAQALTNHGVLLRHATIHAVQLTEQQQAALSDRDRRTYAAGVLRSLAANRLGELDHAHLPWQGEGVSIVATDEVQSQLYGWAIRLENGENL